MSDDTEWMRRMFAEAAERYAELPTWARPVVTPPVGVEPSSTPASPAEPLAKSRSDRAGCDSNEAHNEERRGCEPTAQPRRMPPWWPSGEPTENEWSSPHDYDPAERDLS